MKRKYIASIVILSDNLSDNGYAPNADLENVFMAVSMDTFDEIDGLHPKIEGASGAIFIKLLQRASLRKKGQCFLTLIARSSRTGNW